MIFNNRFLNGGLFTGLLWAMSALPAATDAIVIPEKPTDSSAFRVMTYNVRREGEESKPERIWANRGDLVINMILTLQPDIFGLQEPTESQLTDILRGLETAALPFAQFGEGRGSSWGGKGANEFNPIFYNTELFELLNHGTFSINELGGIWWPWQYKQTGLLPRICTWGKFKQRSTGQAFYFYNTHFDHQYDTAREVCANAVAKHIAAHNSENLPVIITGDLNTEFKGSVREILTGFTPAIEKAPLTGGPRETETGWTEDKLKTIDYILSNDKVEALTNFVITSEGKQLASDHRPVIADLKFVSQ